MTPPQLPATARNTNPFGMGEIEKIDFERYFRRFHQKGVAFIEFFFEERFRQNLELEDQKIQPVRNGSNSGICLRILHHQHSFQASSNDLSANGIEILSKAVLDAVRFTAKNIAPPPHRPPRLKSSPPPPPPFCQDSAKEVRETLLDCDAGVRATANHLQQVRIHCQQETRNVCLVNSEGLFRTFAHHSALLSATAIVQKNGLIQTAYEPLGVTEQARAFANGLPQSLGRRVGEKSQVLLAASTPPLGNMPVVLSARAGGTMVHETVGHGLEADLALENLSVYSDALQQPIAATNISIVDDPTLPHRFGSYPFDDEGTPAQRTELVKEGILQTFLHNRLTALKSGKQSTGNGRRESYQTHPTVRMSNILICPGTESPDDLIAAVPFGLFVEEMGGGEVDTVTGSFVFEVPLGYLIRNGQIDRPVRSATLAGNALNVMTQDLRIGSDLGFSIGICEKDSQEVPVADAQPTLLIPEILVGGQDIPHS